MDSNTEVCRIIKTCDLNVYGKLHGGTSLEVMEEAGYISTIKYLNKMNAKIQSPILCRIENTVFLNSGNFGDYLMAKSKIIFTSEHSIAVNVDIYCHNINLKETKICHAILWYVNCTISKELRCLDTLEVPQITDITNENREKFQEMYNKNRILRKEYKIHNYDTYQYYFERISKNNEPFSCYSCSLPIQTIITSNECNHFGLVYGGNLLKKIDEAAGMTSYKFCKIPVVTVSVDSADFYHPIFTGDICIICPWIIFTSPKSIHVRINVFTHGIGNNDIQQDYLLVCSAIYVFVAIDNNGRPVEVPQLKINDQVDTELYEERKVLYGNRKKI